MRRGTSRILSIATLIILSLVFVGGGILVTIQLQQNQAPDETSAFGFGDEAITSFYDDIDQFFKEADCELLLNDGLVDAGSHGDGQGEPLTNFALTTLYAEPPRGNFQKICNYTEEEYDPEGINIFETFIELDLYTYGPDSYIYESQDEKKATLNAALFDTIIDEGYYADLFVDYTYGTVNSATEQTCRLAIYHQYNEFEYLTIDLNGYDCQSATTTRLVRLFGRATSSFLHESILLVYDEYQFDPNNITVVEPE